MVFLKIKKNEKIKKIQNNFEKKNKKINTNKKIMCS